MSSSTLRDTADRLYAAARGCLVRDGYVASQHFMVSADGNVSSVAFAGLPENSDVAKALIVQALKQLAPSVFAVATVHEVWMAFGEYERQNARVSQRTDRQEALLVIVQSRDGIWTLMSPFRRDANNNHPLPPDPVTASWTPSGSDSLSGNFVQFY